MRRALLFDPHATRFWALVCLFLFIPLSGQAQYRDSLGGMWNNPGSALITTQLLGRLQTKAMKRAQAAKRQARPTSDTPLVSFHRVAPVLTADAFARTMGEDSGQKTELRALFIQFLTSFDREAKDKGHRDDISYATAFFVATNLYAATGQEIEETELEAVRRDIYHHLTGSPTFAAFDDSRRQSLYEALIILGTLAATGYHQALEQNDSAQQATYRQLGRTNLESLFGIPADQIQVGPDGLTASD